MKKSDKNIVDNSNVGKIDSKENKEKHAGGRPSFFKTPESLQFAIDEYFDNCPDFMIFYTKEGEPYQKQTPTMSGLCFYLGFADRQSMYDYANRTDEYSCVIKKAKFRIESIYEKQLLYGNSTGAIFALKNHGWSDKQELEHSGEVKMPQVNFILNREK